MHFINVHLWFRVLLIVKRRVSFDRLIIRTIDAEPMNIFCYSLPKHEPLGVTDVHTRKIS